MSEETSLAIREKTEAFPQHPSSMLERPGPLVAWFYKTFFRHIKVDTRYFEMVRDLSSRGTVVYVMRSRSFINYLFFNALCLSQNLPLARFNNGGSLLWLQPIAVLFRYFWAFLKGRRKLPQTQALRQTVSLNESALLFLRKPRTITTWSQYVDRLIPELLSLQRERERPIYLLPQLLIWERRPAKVKRSIFDVVFGEVSEPGLLRQFWLLALNYKSATVKVSDPVNLKEYIDDPQSQDEETAARIRGQIVGYLEREFRVVLGPQLKEHSHIKQEVLDGRGLKDVFSKISQETNESPDALKSRASKMLDEIGASISFRAIEIMGWILEKVFARIYDGIEYSQEEFARVRDAARKGPLLLLPSHKSHIDYLLVSWLFFREDLMPPHIAAGQNLSFWPLGPLFRRGGAFFLRRSFKGDKLYGAVFRAYVQRLVLDGHNIEFFIEGGRSRSGKLLPPKLGLLGMVVDAFLSGTGKDLQVIPIGIVYEKVLEDKAYQKELLGGQKKSESATDVLKAGKVLGSSYGRVYLHFDEALSLREFLAERGLTETEPGDEYRTTPPDPERVRSAVKELGFRVSQGINQATVVSPSALVATALLTHPRRGMARSDLESRCAFLVHFLRKQNARFSRALAGEPTDETAKEGLQQAIFLFHKNNFVAIHDQGDEVIYSINTEWRPSLDYYKNNLLHHLIEPALISAALLRANGEMTLADLSQEVKELSRLLKHEFLFRADITFDEILRRALTKMQESKLIIQTGSSIKIDPKGAAHVQFFRSLIVNFLESFSVVVSSLDALVQGPLIEKELMKVIREKGERLYLTGEIRRKEACVLLNYQNVLQLLQDKKVLTSQSIEDAKGKIIKTTISLSDAYRENNPRTKLKEEATRYLRPGE
jgi:glycerol-3-phosphate O-acyltransferase